MAAGCQGARFISVNVPHFSSSAATREEAERELTAILRRLDTGNAYRPWGADTGRFLLDQWLPHQATRVGQRIPSMQEQASAAIEAALIFP